jgi:hypothetical protein
LGGGGTGPTSPIDNYAPVNLFIVLMYVIVSTRNDELLTLADRDVDIIGSQVANISRGIDDVVAEAKPVIIVSCWSEAATQETDLGVSQGETACTR